MPSMFVGLGPNGRNITEDQLKDFLGKYVAISSVRVRGTCAFADVETDEDAQKLIAEANDQYLGEARLSIQVSRPKGAPAPRGASSGPVALFIGLGPQGGSVSEDELRQKLEEAAPIIAIRRRGECAFVDVASSSDAERMISTLRGAMVGPCRLSVQYSKDNNSRGGDRGGDMKRGRDSDRNDDRDRRRRRSDSRDRRPRADSRDRRRRSDSRDRRPRADSRDRRRRSPSY
jgi:RNA recognition motif-containing protein